MSFYNEISFNRIADVIDKYLNLDNEKKVINIIDEINRKQSIIPGEVKEIERIFFIWIGDISFKSVEYIDVWIDCFKGVYQLDLYVDSRFLLFGHLKDIFRLYYNITDNTPIDEIILNQNDFYRKIKNHISNGKTFDEAIIYMSDSLNVQLSDKLRLAKIKLKYLSKFINIIDIRYINDVFYNAYLHEMYLNELILRHNAACASDILRLSLLYRDGGMYVDVDTLPCHKNVFDGISEHGNHLVNDNLLDIIKSEYILVNIRKLKSRESTSNSYNYIKSIEELLSEDFVNELKKIAEENICSFFIQERIYVHDEIIKIASINRYYEVNNNVLIANKKSRVVRIVLREIIKRYKYLYANDLVFSTKSNLKKFNLYLSRLDQYRYDSLNNNGGTEVTLMLTGPCIIHEVILGLFYEIAKIPKNISPLTVSYLLRLNRSFSGFKNQVNYTPEHMSSSWM